MRTFEELGVDSQIQLAITELGFEQPMPVQAEVIPPLLLGNTSNIIALAQTGTGKTAAFGIPIIQKTDPKFLSPQTLILCPTRELCLQIAGDLTDYSKYAEDVKSFPFMEVPVLRARYVPLKGVCILLWLPPREGLST